MREYDNHPVILAVCNALRVQNYPRRHIKRSKTIDRRSLHLYDMPVTSRLMNSPNPTIQNTCCFWRRKSGLASSTLNVHINGWKFYCEKILEREKEFYDIAYPRQPVKLPTVYSVTEVKAFFKATTSLKYRTLFTAGLCYGTALSEVAHLRLTDLDRVRRLVHVRGGKGKKDRVVMLGGRA